MEKLWVPSRYSETELYTMQSIWYNLLPIVNCHINQQSNTFVARNIEHVKIYVDNNPTGNPKISPNTFEILERIKAKGLSNAIVTLVLDKVHNLTKLWVFKKESSQMLKTVKAAVTVNASWTRVKLLTYSFFESFVLDSDLLQKSSHFKDRVRSANFESYFNKMLTEMDSFSFFTFLVLFDFLAGQKLETGYLNQIKAHRFEIVRRMDNLLANTICDNNLLKRKLILNFFTTYPFFLVEYPNKIAQWEETFKFYNAERVELSNLLGDLLVCTNNETVQFVTNSITQKMGGSKTVDTGFSFSGIVSQICLLIQDYYGFDFEPSIREQILLLPHKLPNKQGVVAKFGNLDQLLSNVESDVKFYLTQINTMSFTHPDLKYDIMKLASTQSKDRTNWVNYRKIAVYVKHADYTNFNTLFKTMPEQVVLYLNLHIKQQGVKQVVPLGYPIIETLEFFFKHVAEHVESLMLADPIVDWMPIAFDTSTNNPDLTFRWAAVCYCQYWILTNQKLLLTQSINQSLQQLQNIKMETEYSLAHSYGFFGFIRLWKENKRGLDITSLDQMVKVSGELFDQFLPRVNQFFIQKKCEAFMEKRMFEEKIIILRLIESIIRSFMNAKKPNIDSEYFADLIEKKTEMLAMWQGIEKYFTNVSGLGDILYTKKLKESMKKMDEQKEKTNQTDYTDLEHIQMLATNLNSPNTSVNVDYAEDDEQNTQSNELIHVVLKYKPNVENTEDIVGINAEINQLEVEQVEDINLISVYSSNSMARKNLMVQTALDIKHGEGQILVNEAALKQLQESYMEIKSKIICLKTSSDQFSAKVK